MRGLASGVLGLESMVLLLVIPVAVTIADINPWVAIPAGVVLIALCIVAIGGLGRGWGYSLGWVVQVLAIALGFVVPAMFVLGGIFALLWYSALRIARQVEADKASGADRGE
ncbi:MAG: DUF4233 domain-containing protein [Jiangellales bacterium]